VKVFTTVNGGEHFAESKFRGGGHCIKLKEDLFLIGRRGPWAAHQNIENGCKELIYISGCVVVKVV
jgi:hypothetical protein